MTVHPYTNFLAHGYILEDDSCLGFIHLTEGDGCRSVRDCLYGDGA